MKTMPALERPYEKCARKGPAFLSDAELLAVLLRSGSVGENALDLARRILYDPSCGPGEGLERLARGHINRWQDIRGIGRVKAIQLVCLWELSSRMAQTERPPGKPLDSPQAVAAAHMQAMRHLGQEIVKVIFLDTRAAKTGECDVSKGTVNASLITPREIFVEAVRHEAVYIVVMHNHPSGDPSPSSEDKLLTERIAEAGKMIGIPLVDHIVIGDGRYFSFKEHGLIYGQTCVRDRPRVL